MRLILFSFCLFFSFSCFAQEEIFLENPSFEDFPKLSHTPKGWYNCGSANESPVDIHPVPDSKFQVNKTAFNGNTYVGMIVRANETTEAIGQRLSQPLKAGKVYSFSIHLARSSTYLSSLSDNKGKKKKAEKIKKENFVTPIKLRIWGGDGYCKKVELLAESKLVINTRWLNFNFQFEPKADLKYITFEAFYKTPSPYPYNGNILLDNASSIAEVIDGFVTKEPSYQTDTVAAKVEITAPTVQKIDAPIVTTKETTPVKEQKLVVKKEEKKPIPPPRKLESVNYKQEDNKFSSSIMDFYKKHIHLIEFRGESADLDEVSVHSLTLMAERLRTIDKDLKIIIQAKARDAALKKVRMNAIKSVLTKAKLTDKQYTFGYETNTPVLMNESNSSVRIKLCLR